MSCRALGVSLSWFYKWKRGALPASARRRQRLDAEVAVRFAARKGKDGAPRILAALREAGWRVSENTVAALMREQGLAARAGRRRKGTTRPGWGRWRAEDLVRRKFAAGGVNRRWYGDGTGVVTGEGKLYLDSVTGTGSRRIVGFALGEHHDAGLAYGALAMAVAVRGGAVPGVVFHTDQGSEYTARSFRAACERLGIAQPVGRPGSAPGQRGDRVLALHAGVRTAVGNYKIVHTAAMYATRSSAFTSRLSTCCRYSSRFGAMFGIVPATSRYKGSTLPPWCPWKQCMSGTVAVKVSAGPSSMTLVCGSLMKTCRGPSTLHKSGRAKSMTRVSRIRHWRSKLR